VPPLVQILNPRVVLAISKSRELFLIGGEAVIMVTYYFDVPDLCIDFNLSVCIFIFLFFWLDPKETKGQGLI
jgi:hypothetical protein